jgi:hypothetical protein
MDGRTGSSVAGRRQALGWLVIAAMAASGGAQAQQPETATFSRLRPAGRKAEALLSAGIAGSATFRQLVEAIERSDLVVYVETRTLRLPGQLQLVAASPGCRHLRVSIRVPGLDAELTAWLAHELWHAVEIAGAGEVRDQASLLRFYQRAGAGGRADATVETGQAQETWTRVLSELRGVR